MTCGRPTREAAATVPAQEAFILFAVFNGLFILMTLFMVPETKGVSLETIEANLFAGKRLRDLGR